MLMNYHEMTMNEPRHSPQKRKQFLVICTIMAAVFFYTCMTSGMFLAIEPTVGTFEGGEYMYKMASRDYAASQGLGKHIRKAVLGLKSEYAVDDALYHVYLDNPPRMGGRRQRWMSGLLSRTTPPEYTQTLKDKAQEFADSGKSPILPEDTFDVPASEVWDQLPFQRAELPESVKALVLPFAFTNGFVSALIHSYKIIPALRQLGVEHGEEGNVPVVITNCSIKQKMCIHYVVSHCFNTVHACRVYYDYDYYCSGCAHAVFCTCALDLACVWSAEQIAMQHNDDSFLSHAFPHSISHFLSFFLCHSQPQWQQQQHFGWTTLQPLERGKEFLLGHPDTLTHNEALGEEHFLDAKGMKQGLKKVLPWIHDFFFPEPKVKEATTEKPPVSATTEAGEEL
mmetsp:Transcript_12606/g.34730  ORF Transcript_12606/g.34730 Transcript_12606/m.34730 type:complete len:396 (-) Transcript_12606:287-1474(-)